MSSSSETVVLSNIEGFARKSGTDQHGCQWTEFEVDYGAEQEPGECCFCGAALESGWLCLDGGDECCAEHVEFAADAEEPEPWDASELYHDWTSPGESYRVQTRYDHGDGNRTYLAYRLWCRGKLVFEGNDYSGSPLHADDSYATLAGLLHFLSLRPGDTDGDYFDAYTPEQLAFAQEHGEALGLWSEDMAGWDDEPFAVEESSTGFQLVHKPTGRTHWLGDGVDALFTADEPMIPGTDGFTEAWAECLNADVQETLEAYFPDLA